MKKEAIDWSAVGNSVSDFLGKNEYILPGLVAGALLGGGSSLFNPRSSFLGNTLLGALLGGGAGFGLPHLSQYLQGPQHSQYDPRTRQPRTPLSDTAQKVLPGVHPIPAAARQQEQQEQEEEQQMVDQFGKDQTTEQTSKNIEKLLENF